MSLLQEAENSLAFGKIGIFGFQGSGKSFTSWLIAKGISKQMGNNKVAWFDTETGSDFFVSDAKTSGIKLFQVKRRSFVDLLATIDECVKEGIGILIEDSVTHVWRDLCDSYDTKLNRRGRLQFQDWAIIKKEWKTYTDLFINSPLHIIALGRAGFEYGYDFNEDGTKDLIKTGTRFKAESEFGFEPHLVIEMERVTPGQEELAAIKEIKNIRERKEKKQVMNPKIGSGWIHRAHVLKDRTDTIDGKYFDDPTFDAFAPHFAKLNLGGKHFGVDTATDSTNLFDKDGKPTWKYEQEQKELLRAEIKATIDKYFPGSTVKEKKAKIVLKEHVFKVRSDEGLENCSLPILKYGKEYLDWLLTHNDTVTHLLESPDIEKLLISAREEYQIFNSESAQ